MFVKFRSGWYLVRVPMLLYARLSIFKSSGDTSMHVGGVIYSLDWYRNNMSTARPRDRWPQGVRAFQIHSFLLGLTKFRDMRILSLGLAKTYLENLESFTWALHGFFADFYSFYQLHGAQFLR